MKPKPENSPRAVGAGITKRKRRVSARFLQHGGIDAHFVGRLWSGEITAIGSCSKTSAAAVDLFFNSKQARQACAASEAAAAIKIDIQ